MTDRYEALQELDDYKLVNSDQDLRGQGLYTDNGTRLGTVSRMLVDPERDHVAALVLEDGRGVPVDEIEIRDGDAYIEAIADSDYFEAPRRATSVERGRVTVQSTRF